MNENFSPSEQQLPNSSDLNKHEATMTLHDLKSESNNMTSLDVREANKDLPTINGNIISLDEINDKQINGEHFSEFPSTQSPKNVAKLIDKNIPLNDNNDELECEINKNNQPVIKDSGNESFVNTYFKNTCTTTNEYNADTSICTDNISASLSEISVKDNIPPSALDSFSLLLSACSLNEQEDDASSPDSELTQIESDIKKIEEILSKGEELDINSLDVSSFNTGLQEIIKTDKDWPTALDDECLLGLAQSVSSELEKTFCPGSSGLQNIVSAAVNEITLEFYKDKKLKDQLSNDSDSNMVTASEGLVSSCSPSTSSETSQQINEKQSHNNSISLESEFDSRIEEPLVNSTYQSRQRSADQSLNKFEVTNTTGNSSTSPPILNCNNESTYTGTKKIAETESISSASFHRSDMLEYEENGTVLLGAWNELRTSLRQLHRSVVPSTLTNSGLTNPRNRPSINRIKVLANLLLADDPHQLFTRVTQLTQELCIELKVRLLATIYDKPDFDEACTFIHGLCESYEWVINVCEAIQNAFEKMDSDHLSRFGLNWMTVNMHTFYAIIFTDPDVQDYLAMCTAKTEEFAKGKETIGYLVSLKRALTVAEGVWLRAENSLQEYNMERVALNLHKRQLFAGWNQFKTSPKYTSCHSGNAVGHATLPSSDISSRGEHSQCPCSDCNMKKEDSVAKTAETSGGSCECHFCNSSTSRNVSSSMQTVSRGPIVPPIAKPQLSLYPHIHGTSSDIVANQVFDKSAPVPNATKPPMSANPFLGSDLLTEQLIKEWDLAYGDALTPPVVHPTPSTSSVHLAAAPSFSATRQECPDLEKLKINSSYASDVNRTTNSLTSCPNLSSAPSVITHTKNSDNLAMKNETKQAMKRKTGDRCSSEDSEDSSDDDDWSSGNESYASSCTSSTHGGDHSCDCCYCHMLQNMPGGGRQKYSDRRERLLKILSHKKMKSSCSSSNSMGGAGENCMGKQTLDEIMNYIEGRRPTHKCVKKAAKKLRQKERKIAIKKQQRNRGDEETDDDSDDIDTEEEEEEDENSPLAELRRRAPDVTITVVKQTSQQKQAQAQSTATNSTAKHPLATKPTVTNSWLTPNPMSDHGSTSYSHLGGPPPRSTPLLPTARKDPSLAPTSGLSSLLKGMKKEDKDGKGSQMVTIRRVMDPVSSEPTVTITLKGEEPEKDKVLFKLVNGQACQENSKKSAPKVKQEQQIYDIPDGTDPEEAKKMRKKMKKDRQKEKRKQELVEEDIQKNIKEEQRHMELKKRQEFLKEQEAILRKQRAALQRQQDELLNPLKKGQKTGKKKGKAGESQAPTRGKESDNVASNFSLPPGVSINKVAGQPGMVTISNHMGNSMGKPFLPNPNNMFNNPMMQGYGMGGGNFSMYPPSMMNYPEPCDDRIPMKENVIVVDTKPTNVKSKVSKTTATAPTRSKKKKNSFESMTSEEKVQAALKGSVNVDLLNVTQKKKYKKAIRDAEYSRVQEELCKKAIVEKKKRKAVSKKSEPPIKSFSTKNKLITKQNKKMTPSLQATSRSNPLINKAKEQKLNEQQNKQMNRSSGGKIETDRCQIQPHAEPQPPRKFLQGDKNKKVSSATQSQKSPKGLQTRTNLVNRTNTLPDKGGTKAKETAPSNLYKGSAIKKDSCEARYAQYLAANESALANMASSDQPKDRKRDKKRGKKSGRSDELTTIDSVFTPKDFHGAEHYDETDREVEAFKRFCLYNVPRNSGEKPKVSFNVKDIMIKKKH